MDEINSEKEFEISIRKLINDKIISNNHDFIILKSKDVFDIIICKNGNAPQIFFLEIKYQKDSSNRWGIGQEKGTGFQPEILTKLPDFFKSNLRWILGSESNNNYYFLNNTELLSFIQGGKIGAKFNGIQKRLLEEAPKFNSDELVVAINTWLQIE